MEKGLKTLRIIKKSQRGAHEKPEVAPQMCGHVVPGLWHSSPCNKSKAMGGFIWKVNKWHANMYYSRHMVVS